MEKGEKKDRRQIINFRKSWLIPVRNCYFAKAETTLSGAYFVTRMFIPLQHGMSHFQNTEGLTGKQEL